MYPPRNQIRATGCTAVLLIALGNLILFSLILLALWLLICHLFQTL